MSKKSMKGWSLNKKGIYGYKIGLNGSQTLKKKDNRGFPVSVQSRFGYTSAKSIGIYVRSFLEAMV